MAALASSLIRQKREVHEPGDSWPMSAQRRVCPRSTKSLCQKQLLILLSKVRLCTPPHTHTNSELPLVKAHIDLSYLLLWAGVLKNWGRCHQVHRRGRSGSFCVGP